MPELPEVETVVRGLRKFLPGSPVSRVVLANTRKFKSRPLAGLLGRKISGISRRGKNILMGFDDGRHLVIHLGMTGQLCWDSPDRRTDRHTHLQLQFHKDNQVLYFRDVRRFGQLKLYRSKEQLWADEKFTRLGPEPLEVSLAEFRKLLDHKRAIKALLLDQNVIVGFGNIYVDESLFAAGLHPTHRACEISPPAAGKLYRAMRRVFTQAIAAGGSTIRDYRQGDGTLGRFQSKHKVYQRTGQPCLRCRRKIERMIVAGRSSHFCPACQPLDSSKR